MKDADTAETVCTHRLMNEKLTGVTEITNNN